MDAADHATESSPSSRAAGTAAGSGRPVVPATSAALPQVHPERSQVIDLPRLSTLIGRDDARDTLGSWLDDPDDRLVTLTGPGGVGKTRLALEVAYGAPSRFTRIQFVSLAAVTERRAVLPAIARALGVATGEPEEILAHIRELLLAAPTLLILDTFEQVIVAAPDIAILLEQNPQIWALVTSRTALRLPRERVFEVDVLASPRDVPSTADEALAWPAVQLFVDRV
ncbi:MAG: AAA family ATPase, partial [Thermomicrobiales bacterium]